MKKTIALVVLSLMFYTVSAAQAVKFEWAKVGNPSNAPDTEVMNDGTSGYGSVDYSYRISKHEVTNAQYTEFLNAVAATDAHGLFSASMNSSSLGGITRSGTPGSFTYAVKAAASGQGPGGTDYTYDDKPVNYVSFFDAMRFVNWLENGQPTGAQGPGTTEDGVYSISDGLSETRNPGTTFRVPCEDEWYKAAYYDPNGNGGSGVYYDYPTSTNTTSNNNLPSADTGNSANFYGSDYTTGDFSYGMTDVGAYALSESPVGTYDQGGNLWEWNEAVISSSSRRGRRGGSFAHISDGLPAYARFSSNPTYENYDVGFRVAVPEPSSLVLLAIGSLALLRRRR